jgi:hypothetical protein
LAGIRGHLRQQQQRLIASPLFPRRNLDLADNDLRGEIDGDDLEGENGAETRGEVDEATGSCFFLKAAVEAGYLIIIINIIKQLN